MIGMKDASKLLNLCARQLLETLLHGGLDMNVVKKESDVERVEETFNSQCSVEYTHVQV